MKTKKLKPLDGNLLYLIGAILFWTVGGRAQEENLKIGLLITQYGIMMLPPLIYLKIKKISIKETLRFNKLRLKHCLLIALITILMYPVAVFGNSLLMTLMSLIGNLNIPELPTATNSNEFAILIFIISFSAGICEEIFFRGFILSSYGKLGRKKSIIFTAILFGIFHYNLYNLMGPIVLGLVFAYLVTITNSIFAGIIGHMVNNGFAVSLGFLANLLTEKLEMIEAVNEGNVEELSTTMSMAISTVVFAVIGVITAFVAFKLVKIIKTDCEGIDREKKVEGPIDCEEATIEKEGFEEEQEQGRIPVSKTNFIEFLPLSLPLLLFLYVAFWQLSEVIALG